MATTPAAAEHSGFAASVDATTKGLRNALLIAALFAIALLALPDRAAALSCSSQGDSSICVDIASNPADEVQPSRPGNTTYVQYSVLVANDGTVALAGVRLDEELAPATAFESVTINPADGSCSIDGATLRCELGELGVGEDALIESVAEVPAASDPGGLIVNKSTASHVPADSGEISCGPGLGLGHVKAIGKGHSEHGNGEGNGHVKHHCAEDGETVRRSASINSRIHVNDNAEGSWVPDGATVKIATDPVASNPADQTSPGDHLFGEATVHNTTGAGLYASIKDVDDGPLFACVADQFTVATNDPGPFICRDSDHPNHWVEATVPGDFSADPLQFRLIWDGAVVPATQISPTAPFPFAVFHSADGATISAFKQACTFAAGIATNTPCLSDVEQLPSGDWTATLHKDDNGHMR